MKFLISLFAFSLSAVGAEFTYSTPAQLQSALTNAGSLISAGDKVWLRGGIYYPMIQLASLNNNVGWNVTLSGASNNLVEFRAYPGESVRIDRSFRGTGQYLRFRDIEFYASDKYYVLFVGNGNNKHEFINCIIHDLGQVWDGSVVAKIRGCIIWHAGVNNVTHIAYSAFTGQDTDEYSGNISYWPSGQVIELGNPGLTISSNIMVGAGKTIGADSREILFTESGVVNWNCTYDTMIPSRALDVGGATTGVTNNVFASVGPAKFLASATTYFYSNIVYSLDPTTPYSVVTLNGSPGASLHSDYNAYYAKAGAVQFENVGTTWNFTQWKTNGYDANSTSTSSSAPPDLVRVYLNADQAKRAHVAIYNWTLAPNVNVSLAGVLSTGDTYKVYSAQNFKYGPIKTGTYDGSNVSVPMTNLTAVTLRYVGQTNNWGLINPTVTSPEFGAFVIIGAAPGITTVSNMSGVL